MYIKVVLITFKFKNGVLETQKCPAIDNKALSIKSRVREIRFSTDKAYKVRNRVDKNEALGVKKPIMSKGNIRKYPLGFNPSGYL